MSLLFVCSRNRLCSPTAEAFFAQYEGLEVDSAGHDRDAVVPLGVEAIEWADLTLPRFENVGFLVHRNHLN
jgi:predicted protein tyrosine phosphatase